MGVSDSSTLHHTSFVVRDLDAVAEALAASLSVVWNVWSIEPEVCTVHGRDVPFSFLVALAPVGESHLELIQPLEGHSVYVEHLETKGVGFHHICFKYPSLETMRRAQAELASQGLEMIQSGRTGDTLDFCYFRTPETESILELLYLAKLPPPIKTIG